MPLSYVSFLPLKHPATLTQKTLPSLVLYEQAQNHTVRGHGKQRASLGPFQV